MFYEKGHWFVYIYHVKSVSKFYVGLHRGDGKFYYSSTSDVSLKQFIEEGNADCYIALKLEESEPNAQQRAEALERHLITTALEEGVDLYNKNVGGGFSSVDLSLLREEDKSLGEKIILENYFPEKIDNTQNEDIRKRIYDLATCARDAVKNHLDNVENPLTPVWMNIDELLALPTVQIRDEAIDKDHVYQIMTRMENESPEETKRKTRPISIVEFSNGVMKTVNGSHTRQAIKDLNRDSKAAVVIIPYEEFDHDLTLVELYATACNEVEEVVSKGVDQKKEIKLRIKTFYKNNETLAEEDRPEFIEKFVSLYGTANGISGGFSKQRISAAMNSFFDNLEEELNRGENWVDYINYKDKKTIEHLKTKVGGLFNTGGPTHVHVDRLEREGFDNPHQYLYQNIYEDTSVIIASHGKSKTEGTFKAEMSKLHRKYTFWGWELDPENEKFGMIPYHKDGKRIYVYELPSRMDISSVGTSKQLANLIYNTIFVDNA